MARRLIIEEVPLEFDRELFVDNEQRLRQPYWDPDARQLSFSGEIVKQFKWQALNQEAVLNAFQEEHWPIRIDDPLPPHSDQDSKRRLADTIKCLNAKQQNCLIRFHGDGTGEGITWEPVSRIKAVHP